MFADPQGAAFGILASSTGDPADTLAAPDTWIWDALFTRDTNTEAGFYQALFNCDVFPLQDHDDAGRLILASESYARASVNPMPRSQTAGQAYWLGFVRVPDAAAATAKAASLGGRVLVSPRVDRNGGKLAVLADPAGAPFGVMEWPQPPPDARAAK